MSEGPDLKAIEAQLEAIRARLDALQSSLEKRRLPSLTALRRNWWRFSLRTLLLVVTGFACWLGYEIQWIVQRRAMLRDPTITVAGYIPLDPSKTPWIVRFLDEPEITSLAVPHKTYLRAVRLFPEAIVAAPAAPPINLVPLQQSYPPAITPQQQTAPQAPTSLQRTVPAPPAPPQQTVPAPPAPPPQPYAPPSQD